MANEPSDSTHLSDLERSEMVEQYGGKVDSQFAKKSIMRQWVNVQPVRGTDTLMNRRIGKPTLQAVTAGVRPAVSATQFGRRTITVDTILLARDNRDLLNEFQTDFNARMKLGTEHGKELAKIFDTALLIAALKGANANAPTDQSGGDYGGAFSAGNNTTLGSAGDEDDADALYVGIADLVVDMQLDDIDTDECVVFINPTQMEVLTGHTKLVDRDFSKENGDFANGRIKTIKGCPIVMTNRMPSTVNANHLLSNNNNNLAYNISTTEARVVAQVIHPEAILAGETIPLTSKVYYSDVELQWFIDSYIAFGATFNLPEASGALFHTV